jgi:hypothetical protein
MMAEVVAVNCYSLHDPEGFEAAVTALTERVRIEGHPGVLSYRFYRPDDTEGRAVVRYRGPEAWVAHHDLVMGWPEMAALRGSAALREVALFGPVSPAMRDWIARMGIEDRVRLGGEPVAGFHR